MSPHQHKGGAMRKEVRIVLQCLPFYLQDLPGILASSDCYNQQTRKSLKGVWVILRKQNAFHCAKLFSDAKKGVTPIARFWVPLQGYRGARAEGIGFSIRLTCVSNRIEKPMYPRKKVSIYIYNFLKGVNYEN